MVEEFFYRYTDGAWKDLLTHYGNDPTDNENNTEFTYDIIGNLTNDGTWAYTWEHGRQLAGVSKAGTNIAYTYNADGLRSTKTVGSTVYQYYYDPSGQLTDILWGSNKLHFVYDSLGPVAVTYNGTRYYYLRNAQGDITGIMTRNKEQVVSYTYDAWGNVLSVTGTMADTLGAANPLRYRGYLYDSETKLYYLQSRYYNPAWGRFINADGYASTGQGIIGNNSFAYCNNNPCRYADYGGQSPYGILDVTDYYFIHKTVQFKCVWDAGLFMEVPVSGEDGRGRLDLYNPVNNTYYEVKSIGSAYTPNTADQMARYERSIVSGHMGKTLNITTPPTPASEQLSGSFQYGLYDVNYKTDRAGLIVYTPTPNKKRAAIATQAVVIGAFSVIIAATGGSALPAMLPGLIPAFAK